MFYKYIKYSSDNDERRDSSERKILKGKIVTRAKRRQEEAVKQRRERIMVQNLENGTAEALQ